MSWWFRTPSVRRRRSRPAIFDALVADITLPAKMDGRRLASWAVGRWPGLRVVLASGCSARGTSLRTGWSWLQKPSGPAELLTRLAEATGSGAQEA